MLINIVILQDENRTVTDVVGFSDYKKADDVARELSGKYGRHRVQRTSLTVNELPAFWGLDENAAEQSVQPTLLESPRSEVVSCQCGLCKGTHTTLPQSG